MKHLLLGTLAVIAVMLAAVLIGCSSDAGNSEAEEVTSFDVVLVGAGDQKIKVIKIVRQATGLGLRDAKDLVDSAPKTVKKSVDNDEAERLKTELEGAGATVEVKQAE